MNKNALEEYYSREDVATAMVEFSENREISGRFPDGGYGKRPSTLMYPNDVLQMVKQGMISFHCGVELWENPLQLDEKDSARVGWDFLIDLDCDTLDHGREAADILIEAIKAHGIKNIHTKFSGRSGFHIFVPWKAFHPSLMMAFPETPRAMGAYLEDFIAEELRPDVRKGIEIDSIAISSRHLIRMPYSLNEKSGLVSIPVTDLSFDLEMARPDNVKVIPFKLDARPGEAMELAEIATSWMSRKKSRTVVSSRKYEEVKGKIPAQFFPPCIQKMLLGMSDGRKRSEFILRNLMSNVGWTWEEMEAFLLEWNQKNKPPLPENYIRGHITWHKNQKRKTPPPNCDRKEYYQELGLCTPENLCEGVRNPLPYTMRKYRHFLFAKKEEEQRDQANARRKKQAENYKAKKEQAKSIGTQKHGG
ncbi:MAG: hypothetical protein GOV00_00015 [Candidatus Altiarchaeota archaeon]|nr:hypothetical protein [Candidatus Altiarchaeota archaeon]